LLGGEEYLEADELVMKQRYIESNSNNGTYDIDYQIGQNIRIFENLGNYKDNKFIPDNSYFEKRVRESKFDFVLSQDSCRPHLYGKPLDWEGNDETEHNHEGLEKPLPDSEETQIPKTLERESKPFLESSSETGKSAFFSWWLIGIVILIVVLGFIFLKSKPK